MRGRDCCKGGDVMKIRHVFAGGLVLIAAACTPSGTTNIGQSWANDLGGVNSREARVSLLRSSIRSDPNNLNALAALAQEHRAAGDWASASNAYREALLLDRGNVDLQLGYATTLTGQELFMEGYNYASAALRGRRSLSALITAGVALDGMNRPEEAQALYREALESQPRDLDTRSNLAISMALRGDPKALPEMFGVASAPDADIRHRANLILVAALLGRVNDATALGKQFGIGTKDVRKIIAKANEARKNGAAAIGIASNAPV